MKCPKCQYISFDSPDRCRNCGYDFSLAPGAVQANDPPLRRTSDTEGPLPDLSLKDSVVSELTPTPSGRSRARGDRLDLPLFNEPIPGLDDTPLISTPSAPRAPLAVRKATPDPSRISRPPGAGRGPRHAEGEQPAAPGHRGMPAPAADALQAHSRHGGPDALSDKGLPDGGGLFPGQDAAAPLNDRPAAAKGLERRAHQAGDAAPAGARVLALAIDLAILAAIDVVVLHFTLEVVRYPWGRLVDLPLLPLAAFCLLLDAGYVVAFTVASGQTIGKMLTGVRVVTDESWRVPVTQAAIRTAIAPLSLLPFGLGYVPALVGRDRRALHDRLSNTRVVRA